MEPIAIVGMSCIFPQAPDKETFWKNIEEARDCTREITEARFGLTTESMLGKKGIKDTLYTSRCGYIDFEVDLSPFDSVSTAVDLSKLDLYYQWLLHLSYEALKDAGYKNPLSGSGEFERAGLILANLTFSLESAQEQGEDLIRKIISGLFNQSKPRSKVQTPPAEDYYNTHQSALPASLVSDIFGFGVPSFALDAACASSLYAIYHACEKLRANEGDLFLACGVNRSEMAALLAGFSQLSALSQKGKCRPFGEDGDGLLVGEGGGILVLKRLGDALEAGDRIHALIRHTGLSCDGRGSGLLSPHSKGQVKALEKPYKKTAICPSKIDLIECHGTATPKGDSTEITSMKELFGPTSSRRSRPCAIGSIKSMVGHCLSAAGMAGIFKILMAVKTKKIPPTRSGKVSQKIGLENSPFYVPQKCEDWEDREDDEPRRAAVSGFGFGGTNAHTLIEEFRAEKPPIYTKSTINRGKIAIVGMAAEFGDSLHLDDFWNRVISGTNQFFELPAGRWPEFDHEKFFPNMPKGLFLNLIELDLKKFRMTPAQIKKLLPQQLLISKVAREAITSSGLTDEHRSDSRFGVIIGLNWMASIAENTIRLKVPRLIKKLKKDLEVYLTRDQERFWIDTIRSAISLPVDSESVTGDIPNFPASRVSSDLDFQAPSYVVFQEEGSSLKAVELAIDSLQRDEADYMLVGGCDLPGDFKQLFAERGLVTDRETITPVEGAAAIILKRASALHKNERALANILTTGGKRFNGLNIDRIAACSELIDSIMLEHPKLSKQHIELSLPHSQYSLKEQIEDKYEGHVSHFQSQMGNFRSTSGIFALIKNIKSLQTKVIPLDDNPTSRRRGDFATPWLLPHGIKQRQALIFESCRDGNTQYLIIEEAEGSKKREGESLYPPKKFLFLVSGKSSDEIRQNLTPYITNPGSLDNRKLNHKSFTQIIEQSLSKYSASNPQNLFTASIICKDISDLQKKVTRLAGHLDNRLTEINDPSGIYYSENPMGRKGKLSLVYPGFGNVYHGMGRQLALTFPHLLDSYEKYSAYSREICRMEKLWYEKEVDLFSLDTTDITVATTFNSCLYSDLFMNDLKVPASMVIGHSGGEINCLSALRVWHLDDYYEQKGFVSLFGHEFGGHFKSVQNYYKSHDKVDWETYLIFSPAEPIKKKLDGNKKVFLTLINSPVECMIAGLKKETQEFLKSIDVEFLKIPIPQVYHCPILNCKKEEFNAFWSHPCEVPDKLTFYSHAEGRPYKLSENACAEKITRTAVECVDFIPVIEHAYDESNARIFLELGPQSSVSRYIDDILKGREFVTIAANTRERDEYSQLLFALAQLAVHGVHFKTDILPRPQEDMNQEQKSDKKAFIISQPVGRTLGSTDFNKLATQLTHNCTISKAVEFKGDGKVISIEPLLRTENSQPVSAPVSKLIKKSPSHNSSSNSQLKTPATKHKQETTTRQTDSSSSSSSSSKITVDHSFSKEERTMSRNTNFHEINRGGQHQDTSSQSPGDLTEYLILQNRISEVHEQFLQQQHYFLEMSEDIGGNNPTNHMYHSTENHLNPEIGNMPIAEAQPTPPAKLGSENHPVSAAPSPQQNYKKPALSEIYIPEGDKTPPEKFIDNCPEGLVFDKSQIYAFARGSIVDIFGPEFEKLDHQQFRTRFPDDPYLLVDRVTYLNAEPKKLKPGGTIVTEFDVREDHWFLENGHVPIAVCIESGQADLLLIAWMGIDFHHKGDRAYRLLGCDLTFYQDAPKPPCTLKYEITINSFVKHEGVHLFYFNGYGYVNGQLFIKWENGCAGYFTMDELGQKNPYKFPEINSGEITNPYIPVREPDGDSFTYEQLQALTRGDYAACFGESYAVPLPSEKTLRLANEKILFLHRVTRINKTGGRWSQGRLEAEFDLQDDAWYFESHFPTDPVLAGTLILDGCAQLIEFYFMYLGFGFQFPDAHFQPVKYQEMKIKCRGQVIPGNRVMQYYIDVKEFTPGVSPKIIADVVVLSDGKEVVYVENMAYEIISPEHPALPAPGEQAYDKYNRPVVVNESQIVELTIGKPSRYFGSHYKIFDRKRQISRMPNIPYGTIDRVHELSGELRKITRGVSMTSEVDLSPDDWYFKLNHGVMPFCFLNEIVLQPCGLLPQLLELDMLSENDRFIRNLNGQMRQLVDIYPHKGSIIQKVVMKDIVSMPSMFMVTLDGEYFYPDGTKVAEGFDLKFGFGTKQSLLEAPGLHFKTGEKNELEAANEKARKEFSGDIIPLEKVGQNLKMPLFPLNFLDEVVEFLPTGGRFGKGYVKAVKKVNPKEWIFYSHFYMDPVVPGSYSLEAIGQLIEYFMLASHMDQHQTTQSHFRMAFDEMFNWGYRGQVLRHNHEIVYELEVKEKSEGENPWVIGEGRVYADGKYIYELHDLKVAIKPYG